MDLRWANSNDLWKLKAVYGNIIDKLFFSEVKEISLNPDQ